ncbi:MAG: hypothetical protein EBS55_11445 [Flavobacteriaceae bacterium]|jgi:hypothetical protein|nr:hypothetical protein [Flavobacteriaceae bacterium]
MPKFMLGRDLQLFRSIARELVDTVIENTCVLFKVNLNETKVNIYGESMNKTWHPGVELFVLIDKEPDSATYEGFGPDEQQNITFKFDRLLCEERNTYPEIGDVIYFDNSYYEIDNTNEIQFVGGLPGQNSDRNWSIVCSTFMVSKSNLNIEERIK